MPRGLGWSAGMALPMPTGDNIVFSLERDFAKGPVERERIGILDRLRDFLEVLETRPVAGALWIVEPGRVASISATARSDLGEPTWQRRSHDRPIR